MSNAMTIGQAAERSGVSPKTIRYYESVGIVSPASRNQNRYRAYGSEDVQILRFVSRARGLGFSLKEVKQLLSLYGDRNRPSRDVKRLAQKHIDELDQKIEQLVGLRQALSHLAEKCLGNDRPECAILDSLIAPAPAREGRNQRTERPHGTAGCPADAGPEAQRKLIGPEVA